MMTTATARKLNKSKAKNKNNVIPIRDFKNQTGYRWRQKDPMLDQVIHLMDESSMSYSKIAELSGVSKTTLRNWRFGVTRRPYQVTMKFVLKAMGYDIGIFRTSGNQRRWIY